MHAACSALQSLHWCVGSSSGHSCRSGLDTGLDQACRKSNVPCAILCTWCATPPLHQVPTPVLSHGVRLHFVSYVWQVILCLCLLTGRIICLCMLAQPLLHDGVAFPKGLHLSKQTTQMCAYSCNGLTGIASVAR